MSLTTPGWLSPRTSSTGAPRPRVLGSRGGIDLVDRAADHQRDQPVDGHLGRGPSPTTWPSRSTVMSSHRRITSPRMWLM